MLRYIFLTVEQRNASNDRPVEKFFAICGGEMKDITIIEVLNIILIFAFEKIRAIVKISKEIVDQIMDIFLGIVIEKYHLKRHAA